MKLCRFSLDGAAPAVGVLSSRGDRVIDLSAAGIARLDQLLERPDLPSYLKKLPLRRLPSHALSAVRLLPPVDEQEIWAVGVTYLRSKAARMEESDFSATAYDRVYEAPRPELFFKAVAHKAVGPDELVGIRRDANWNVPEPELVLVFNSRGDLVGYTVGNDMSSRDIEGENLLYLPQAKIYDRSCALGPWIVVGVTEAAARRWTIEITIQRKGTAVFAGDTKIARIKRTFGELKEYLFRSQTFPRGALLFTGTGVVPGDDFTLRKGDVISISISGVGTLRNAVTLV
jgi:2-dehydro-3-deoxy-D-arabinonate dehydratase